MSTLTARVKQQGEVSVIQLAGYLSSEVAGAGEEETLVGWYSQR